MTKKEIGSSANGVGPFAHFAAEAEQDDTEVAVEIMNRKGEPYLMVAGAPVTITVLGEYSQQYKRAERRITDRVLKRARRGGDFDSEDSEDVAAEKIAGACTAWTVEDSEGKLVPFSSGNVVTFLKIAPWVVPQLLTAIKAHDRFFARSSTS